MLNISGYLFMARLQVIFFLVIALLHFPGGLQETFITLSIINYQFYFTGSRRHGWSLPTSAFIAGREVPANHLPPDLSTQVARGEGHGKELPEGLVKGPQPTLSLRAVGWARLWQETCLALSPGHICRLCACPEEQLCGISQRQGGYSCTSGCCWRKQICLQESIGK